MATSSSNWDNLCEEYLERIIKFSISGQGADCDFLVGAEPDQEYIRGHKIILAKGSPVFEAMFYGEMTEQNQILIPDIQPETFQALLKYMYTQRVEISSFENSWLLYYAAKKYMLHVLASECVKYLLPRLGPENACRGYEFAKWVGDQILEGKCLEIIRTRTDYILENNGLSEVEIGTLLTVFQQKSLNINSEVELYCAAIKYAKARGYCLTTRQVEAASPTPSELDADTNQISFYRALREIRFLTMTVVEFAKGVRAFPLLSDAEVGAISTNIILPSCGTAMPDGFSISREWRGKQCKSCSAAQLQSYTMNRCPKCVSSIKWSTD